MKRLMLVGALLVVVALPAQSCAVELTPEQKQLVADLKQDLGRIRHETEQATKIDQAIKDDATYSGALINKLIRVRLQVLKTNEALIEQRIHALEAGARIAVVVNAAKPDPTRAAELANEIESQKAKVVEARAEADRYSGGLVQAMAETAVATARNTLAMLEQQYFISKYGIAMPSLPSARAAPATKTEPEIGSVSSAAAPAAEAPSRQGARGCLKIETFDSSFLSTNSVFTELAWKVDVSNSCDQSFDVQVTFAIYDKDEFLLDSDSEEVYVPARGIGKARDTILVSPPQKAQRMAKQGANLTLQGSNLKLR